MTRISKTFQLAPRPRLVFRSCTADVRIRGWDKEQVELLLRQESETMSVQEVEGGLEISTTVPLTANVPVESTAALEDCTGDLRVEALDELFVNKHRGDLSLSQVKRIEIAVVYGDVGVRGSQSLHVATLNGDLQVRGADDKVAVVGVRGDVSLKETSGQVSLHDVTGDVSILDSEGDVEVHDLNGDVELGGNLQSGQCSIETNGNVAVYLDPSSNAHLELEAPHGRVACTLKLGGAQESAHRLTGALGSGAAQLKVVAHNGDIKARQRRATKVQHESERELARADARTRREAERAQRRAEKLRRKGERLEEKARLRRERLAQKAQQRRRRSTRGAAQARAARENLEQERLAVLRMLAESKISAEQAETLLGALEG